MSNFHHFPSRNGTGSHSGRKERSGLHSQNGRDDGFLTITQRKKVKEGNEILLAEER